MSADNFVGVRPQKVNGNLTGNYEIFEYGCMSILDEDCMYLADSAPTVLVTEPVTNRPFVKSARGRALVQAHDMVNRMDICEYGVVELEPIPDKPCGRCWRCVNERKIIAEDIQRCDSCRDPITASEWMVTTSTGTYHNRCEPGR